jgi:hypothetical protein
LQLSAGSISGHLKGIADGMASARLQRGRDRRYQRYERGSTIVTSNLPFDEWTDVFGSERLTGALLDRLTHHVHILEMNGVAIVLRGEQDEKRASIKCRRMRDGRRA